LTIYPIVLRLCRPRTSRRNHLISFETDHTTRVSKHDRDLRQGVKRAAGSAGTDERVEGVGEGPRRARRILFGTRKRNQHGSAQWQRLWQDLRRAR
jgi:hypothetical protein